jgi:hypothetical protein
MIPRTRLLLDAPMLRLAAPNVLVMVAQASVGLIETYFVSKLGIAGLAGVALVYPLVMNEAGRELAPVAPIGRPCATAYSTAIRAMWQPMRHAGATARTMLVAAAAKRWNVDPASCRAQSGEVLHGPTGRRAKYGDLAADAARTAVPEKAALLPLSGNWEATDISARYERARLLPRQRSTD